MDAVGVFKLPSKDGYSSASNDMLQGGVGKSSCGPRPEEFGQV